MSDELKKWICMTTHRNEALDEVEVGHVVESAERPNLHYGDYTDGNMELAKSDWEKARNESYPKHLNDVDEKANDIAELQKTVGEMSEKLAEMQTISETIADLKASVEKMSADLVAKDKIIAELQKKIGELSKKTTPRKGNSQ